MSFRKRSLSRPSSSRASNKMRLNAKGGTAEIESWIDFASNHQSDIEQLNPVHLLSVKQESKDSFCELECKKKRQIKMLVKIIFEQQMLIKFKRFSDGMLLKMDEQNQLLSHLISSQRSIYTSTLFFKNTELFRGPYPYEKFEKNHLSQLENESLRIYKEQLKF